MTTSRRSADYPLGNTDAEHRRLIRQAARVAPITERFFREAGIGPGQRVLDLGSGVGDVAMLVARLVGPSGEVVAIEADDGCCQGPCSRNRGRLSQRKVQGETHLDDHRRTATFPAASNGTSRSSANPRRLRTMTTLVRSWIRMEPSCFASTSGARTSIPP